MIRINARKVGWYYYMVLIAQNTLNYYRYYTKTTKLYKLQFSSKKTTTLIFKPNLSWLLHVRRTWFFKGVLYTNHKFSLPHLLYNWFTSPKFIIDLFFCLSLNLKNRIVEERVCKSIVEWEEIKVSIEYDLIKIFS